MNFSTILNAGNGAFCLVFVLAVQSPAAVLGEAKKAYRDLADDKHAKRVVLVEKSPFSYEIEFRGKIDGTMTRMPISYGAYVQGWQPNRSLLVENVGQADVHNPWVLVNGKRNWRTLKDVVAEATRGYSKPADRARAIWEFRRRARFHACTWDGECNDLVKVLNVYGYTLCGNEAVVINDLWKAAGLVTRRGHPIGHCVSEVFYDGGYHLLDSDEHIICLGRDNKTIASCAEIVRDHDLIKRTHAYGIGNADNRRTDEFSASLYWYEGKREGDYGMNTRHTMDYVLRPGESIELRWDHLGKEYSAGTAPVKGQPARDGNGTLIRWGATAYDKLRNARFRYRPELATPLARQGAHTVEGATFDTKSAAIKPADPKQPASVSWRFASPYVFVGASAEAAVRLAAGASAKWQYSKDSKQWKTVAVVEKVGSSTLAATLDEVVSPGRRPTYEFWLQLVLEGDATAADVSFASDVQTALLCLPELEVGTNRIVYSDSNRQGRKVRLTHRWLERTAWAPPKPPAEALAPKHGELVAGSKVEFRWSPPADPDGKRIVDYHFELSEYEDMRWPLGPNFEKVISRTRFRGKACWSVPYVGLLNPETLYYWRVRARDANGVWGPWSATFRFEVQAPGVPFDVKLSGNGSEGFTLRWRASPQGTPPVAYKVYGSDERGFTASDTPHKVFRGKGFVKTIEEFEKKPADAPDAGMVETPGNLIARVEGTSLKVVGADLRAANTNKAYYRVVAVDSAGNQSGPSDYAEVPRPCVFTRPSQKAQLGKPYSYQPGVIRSIGHLTCRRSPKSSYNAAFWERDEHTFTPSRLPEGLSLDRDTGAIRGKPARAGTFDVAFEVANQSGGKTRVAYRLTVTE